MKLGLIQTQGIGDIIIALPIAAYYTNLGYKVFWPINSKFCRPFQAACPEVEFIPIDPAAEESRSGSFGYFVGKPHSELTKRGCDRIISLYSALSGLDISVSAYTKSLKFDEYKYAVAGVPFAEKWRLKLQRDKDAERRLFDSLGVTRPFIAVHTTGSNFSLDVQLPEDWTSGHDIIKISPLTDNFFDWLYVLENASKLVMVDSCYANLVDQLNIPCEKHLYLRSDVRFTPVFKNGWMFH